MKNYTGIGCARVWFCDECGAPRPRFRYANLEGVVLLRFCSPHHANLWFDVRQEET